MSGKASIERIVTQKSREKLFHKGARLSKLGCHKAVKVFKEFRLGQHQRR